MAKTAAERQRARREKLKNDPVALEQYRKKDCQRKKTARERMTAAEQNGLRLRVKHAVARFRQRCRDQDISQINTPQVAHTRIQEVYPTPASLGKAKRKALKALPKSPRKKAAIVRCLANDVLDAYLVTLPTHGNSVDEELKAKVQEFYQRDSISRMMPGKADYVTLRLETGEKTRMQKRHLALTLREVYQAFLKENPAAKIGKSKFMDLRPKWVLLSSQMPHNVCCCIYHSNVILLLESLHRRNPHVIPLYSKAEFVSKCVCSTESEECMSNNCGVCSDGQLFIENFSRNLVIDDGVFFRWFQWSQKKDQYIEKVEKEGSTEQALEELRTQLPTFLWHCFIKSKQSAAYEAHKTAAKTPESRSCVLQMDFAENFTCQWQDEIQSAHWRQRQVTLYTVMIYHRERTLSYVIASDCRDHDKNTVAAFTSKVLDIIQHELPSVTNVNIWTDGPSSQFKNRYIFTLGGKLQESVGLQLCWNFFATSHGKGPNDALGGVVKRTVFRMIMSRSVIVNSAVSFAAAFNGSDLTTTVLVMNKEQIEATCALLSVQSLWEGLKGFPGTITAHCFYPGHKAVITKFYTESDEASTRPIQYTELPAGVEQNGPQLLSDNVEEPSRPSSPTPSTSLATLPLHSPPPPNTTSGESRATKYICPRCRWCYGNKDDPKLDEEWLRCQGCKEWFHLSCAEDDGIIDDEDAFNCYSCLM